MSVGEVVAPAEVAVEDEPPWQPRVRYPGDLFRVVGSVLLLGVVALLGLLLEGTLGGVESDIEDAASLLPQPLVNVLGAFAGFVGLFFPFAALALVGLRRQPMVLVQLMVAVMGALLVYDLYEAVTRTYASAEYATTLLGPATAPTKGVGDAAFVAGAYAATSVTALVLPPGWQRMLSASALLFATFSVVSSPLNVLSVVAAVVIGWGVGGLVRYALGSPNRRPTGAQIASGLADVGLPPRRMVRTNPDDSGVREYRVYAMPPEHPGPPEHPMPPEHPGPRQLLVRVRDSHEHSAGLLARTLRSLWYRGAQPANRFGSVRTRAEAEALVTLAASAAGARVVRFVAATDSGRDSVAVAYEIVPGRQLDTVPPDDISDDVLRDAWGQIARIRAARVTHLHPTLSRCIVDDRGRVWLTGFASGNIAATDLQMRVDVAHLLVSMALVVGPTRAVNSAVAVLGAEIVGRSLPALQPLALDPGTRAGVKNAGGLLDDLRAQACDAVGLESVEVEELRRLSPRRLVTIVASATALYLVLPQIAELDLQAVVEQADPRWAVVAVVLAMLSYLGNALGVIGFVPKRIPLWPAVRAQLAAAFASLLAPSFVGVLAVNTRFLQKQGVDPAVGVTVMGVNSVANIITNLFWLFVLIVFAGASTETNFEVPSGVIWWVSAALLVFAGVLLLVPRLRRWGQRQLVALVNRIGPALLSMVQQPHQMAVGFGGLTLTILLKSMALQASLWAFGADLSFANTAAVFIIGNSLGMLVPTPGGLGGVEAAMTAALTAVGVNSGVAVLTVLLFRLATFWIPLLPGWFMFTRMERRGEL